ncbi:excisionase [Veillonella magna]|uniref:excisionase n=1 Tax=Veillonella magna TaxID=464322 RepID=UPI0026DD55CF|nr:excisionase [Veillonella magna]
MRNPYFSRLFLPTATKATENNKKKKIERISPTEKKERFFEVRCTTSLHFLSTGHFYVKEERMPMKKVPIWEKSNLSLEEAAAYSGIGINKLRDLTNDKNCDFVLWVGNKRLIKRRLLDQYIEKAFSI